jgi:hypothetical protein
MARRAYWPNMELIKARLSQISQADFDVICTAIRQHGKMSNKLSMLNQQWRAAASREKGMDAWEDECREAGMNPRLFDLMDIPKSRESDFYREIEKIIQEEHDRRSAETQAQDEEQSRQITDEDLGFLHNAELVLIEVILRENIQSPKERLDVLRLVYVCSKSPFSMLVWRKWKSIAASNSEEIISKASEIIHKELKRRRLSPRREIDRDIDTY